MKRFILCLLCLLLPIPALAVDDEGLRPPIHMTITLPDTQLLNIRAQAKKDASTYGQARGGDDLYVASIDGDWATVDFDDHTAYVLLRYLEITAEVDCTVRSDGRVRVREKPNGQIGSFLHDGDEVLVKAWSYDSAGTLWARISTGYVMASFLELIESSNEEGDI